MRCEVSTLPAATDAGGRGSTTLPRSVRTVRQRRTPSLAGTSGAATARSA
jgi:hypothetical protein